MAYKSKVDSRAYANSHYTHNKKYYLDKSKKNKNKQRDVLRQIIRDSKNIPCKDCGKIYPYYVMHFDHIGDNKLFNIADGVGQGITVKKLMEEIKKCDVVCSNCHSIRTHERNKSEHKTNKETSRSTLQLSMDL